MVLRHAENERRGGRHMGLGKIVGIRQYTTFTRAGKVIKMYEVTFTTERTEGEFTFDVAVGEYTAAKAVAEAETRAEQLDAAIK